MMATTIPTAAQAIAKRFRMIGTEPASTTATSTLAVPQIVAATDDTTIAVHLRAMDETPPSVPQGCVRLVPSPRRRRARAVRQATLARGRETRAGNRFFRSGFFRHLRNYPARLGPLRGSAGRGGR